MTHPGDQHSPDFWPVLVLPINGTMCQCSSVAGPAALHCDQPRGAVLLCSAEFTGSGVCRLRVDPFCCDDVASSHLETLLKVPVHEFLSSGAHVCASLLGKILEWNC